MTAGTKRAKVAATMIVPEVVVEIEMKDSGYLRARVIQHDSNGEVYGRNMLANNQYTDPKTAKAVVLEKLHGKVGKIIFNVAI